MRAASAVHRGECRIIGPSQRGWLGHGSRSARARALVSVSNRLLAVGALTVCAGWSLSQGGKAGLCYGRNRLDAWHRPLGRNVARIAGPRRCAEEHREQQDKGSQFSSPFDNSSYAHAAIRALSCAVVASQKTSLPPVDKISASKRTLTLPKTPAGARLAVNAVRSESC